MDSPKVKWYKILFCCVFGDSDSKVLDDSRYQTISEGDHEAGSDPAALVSNNEAEKMQRKKKKKKNKKKNKKKKNCEDAEAVIASDSVKDPSEDIGKDEVAAVPCGGDVVVVDNEESMKIAAGSSQKIRKDSVGDIAALTCTRTEVNEPTFSSEFALKVVANDIEKELPWWVDSGATQHMNPEKKDFVEYTAFDDPVKVNLADKSYILAYGSGQIPIRLFDVNQPVDVLLKNVLYVPKIKNRLFSVSSAVEDGGCLQFDRESVTLKKDGKSKTIGTKIGKLYHLNRRPDDSKEYCNLVKRDNVSLWHERFGHLNSGDLKLLNDQRLVNGMEMSSVDEAGDDVCHGCALGKSKRLPFPKKSFHKTTKPLQLIHSDVCGPVHVPSLGGSRYFVTFTDDYSRYVTVNILKTKDEVNDKFEDFLNLVENQHDLKVKKFRSDGGGEYISNEFKKVCRSRGIEVDGTIPYSPQQNGVAERMGRTLMEMARSMLYHANLPQKFWAEAISTAAYLRNRCPTSSFKGATPYERWFGVKPDVEHLRVFGCNVYVHIPDEKRRKLDAKAVEGVFVGYPAGQKGYKIFIPESKRFVSSRDVTFMEKSFCTDDIADQGSLSTFDTVLQRNSQFTGGGNFEVKCISDDEDDQILENVEIEDERNEHDITTDVLEDDHVTIEGVPVEIIPDHNHRYPRRMRVAPDYYVCEKANVAAAGDPGTFKQALRSGSAQHWKTAMEKEYSSLTKHETWELVDLPEDANLVGSKWVYKTKRNADGTIDKHKARLVAQGYTQEEGIDYNEVFAPVAKYKSIRTILAIANQLDLEVHQMDVCSAFLNGVLEEDIYMKQPEGFISEKFPKKVCKLKKSLYGLKQSARVWNKQIDEYLKKSGYIQNTADPCIYYRVEEVEGRFITMIVGVYVDETILMSNDNGTLLEEKKRIGERFEMEDRGEVHFILGMEVKRDRKNRRMTICQTSYLQDVLARFGMEDCNPVSTPMEAGKVFTSLSDDEETVDIKKYQAAVGSLNYAAIATRPDISTAVGKLSQFMRNPGSDHWSGIKRILRYIKGTINHGLTFTASDDFALHGYSDADWAGCTESRKSTSGYAFFIGSCIVSWASKKQSIVALSSTEAEYVALCSAAQETVWLRNLLAGIGFQQNAPTCVKEDNQGAICLAKNPKDHNRTKHIDIKFHYTRQLIASKELRLEHVPTGKMVADTMTKGLPKPKFTEFRSAMGIQGC